MEKTFLNKRDPAFDQKVADLLAQGWTQKEKLQERLDKKNLRKHIRNATVKARLPGNLSRISPANLNRAYANVDQMLNAEYEQTKNMYAPFFRLYNANTKKNKKGKKNNNVVMIQNTAIFATPQNEEAMRAYIEANPHLMSNKERSLYEKKKHALAMNELAALYDKMQSKEGNQDIGPVAASAAATPFARVPVHNSKPLSPLSPLSPPSSMVGSLANLLSTKESNLNYSRSKKRLINTRKYPHRPKKGALDVKSLGLVLPITTNMGSSAAAATPAVAVPLRLNNNNNNNTKNNNTNNNNNNTRSKSQKSQKRQKPNNSFRFMNWK